jgi:hypothetical protein
MESLGQYWEQDRQRCIEVKRAPHHGSTAGVAVRGDAFSALPVRLVRKRMHAAGIDPAIVEVEKGADRDGEVDGFVVPACLVQRLHVFGCNPRRVVIYLYDEAEQGFVLIVERRAFEVAQGGPDQVLAAQQFRRTCGVGLDSKRAIVAVRSERRDQLPHAGT